MRYQKPDQLKLVIEAMIEQVKQAILAAVAQKSGAT
jgi:hypothetical protein